MRPLLPSIVASASVLLPALQAVAQEKAPPAAAAAAAGTWAVLDGASRGGAWAAFEARYGTGWSIYVDPAGGTPSMIVGPGIPAGVTVGADEAGIARARAFLEELAGILGVDDPSLFILERAVSVENPWGHEIVTVNFKQTLGGLEVLHQSPGGSREHLAQVRFLFDGTLGRLALLGSTAAPGLGVSAATALSEREALAAALPAVQGMALEWTRVRSYISVRETGSFLAREAVVATSDPPHEWRFVFDARTGALVDRLDNLRSTDVVGRVAAGSLDFPGGTFDQRPARSLRVSVTGGAAAVTDSEGNFRIPHGGTAPVTITGRFLGDWTVVSDASGNGELSFSQVATPGVQANVVLNPLNAGEFETAEAGAYHWATATRWFLRRRHPGFGGLAALPVSVNRTEETCNARGSASGLRFFRAAGGCNNSAYADVVAHEYGHAFHEWFHGSTNPAGFSEAIGDNIGLYLTGQRVMGRNFRTNGTPVRDYRAGGSSNNRQLNDPACGGEEHCLGEAWGGCTMDLRDNLIARWGQAPGVDIAERIVLGQYASNPENEPIAGMFVMVYDDDDGNLSTGTPNCADIRAALVRHSIPVHPAIPADCGTGPTPTTVTLSNGPGNGSIFVVVDGYGSYGIQSGGGNLLYDDLGGAGPQATTFQSAVLFVAPRSGMTQWLASGGGWPGPVLPRIAIGTGNVSSWNIAGFAFRLTQRIAAIDPDGSTIQQTYEITNRTGAPQEIQMIRYVDADLWGVSSGDSAGASARAPGTPNDHWVFAYKQGTEGCTVPRPEYAISAEGRDQTGAQVAPCGYEARSYPTLRDALHLGGCLALTRYLHNDMNGDLVICPPEPGYDVTCATGARFLDVPNDAVVRFHTRTRLTERSPGGARDVIPLSRSGRVNAGQGPAASVLFVNSGAGPCVTAPGAVTISMRAPPAGPNPAHYVVYGVIGRPNTGEFCGGPIAPDVAEWGFLGTGLGTGSFSILPGLFAGQGGATTYMGLPLVSSISGLAILTGPLAAGGGAGTTLLNLPSGIPFSVTIQGVVLDLGSTNGFLSLTNAVEIAGGGCGCQP